MKKKIIIGAAILVIIAGVVLVLYLLSRNKNDISKYEKKAID
jgi:hypothetical protein